MLPPSLSRKKLCRFLSVQLVVILDDLHYFEELDYESARPDAAQVFPDFPWIAAPNDGSLLLVQASLGHDAVRICKKPFSQPSVA